MASLTFFPLLETFQTHACVSERLKFVLIVIIQWKKFYTAQGSNLIARKCAYNSGNIPSKGDSTKSFSVVAARIEVSDNTAPISMALSSLLCTLHVVNIYGSVGDK